MANREFYSKGNATIIEHNGSYENWARGTFAGNHNFHSMEEINSYYKKKAQDNVVKMEKALATAKENAKMFE